MRGVPRAGAAMEHLEFFELPSDPFQNDADARFYYESAPQKRARLRLLRGIHQKKGLSVLEGGPGLGKTTLAHVVLRTLEEKDYAAHYLSIPHESCASGWLLPNVARAFGVPVLAGSVSQLVDQIHAQLVAITTARRSPVLLIDEAQLFRNREAMEEFRGLLNLSHEGRKLVSLVLFGLPELGELLKLDPPLAQRVEVRVEMTAMDWLESQAYVSHRLRLAGATHPVFSPDALEALFRWSGGVPRVLNTLADNAIFEGFLTETRPIDSHVVVTAAQALGLVRISTDSVPNIPPPAPSGPDLLAVTEIAMPEKPQRPAAKAAEPAPKPVHETMPVAKPSPAPAAAQRGPKIELSLDDDEPALAELTEPEAEPVLAESAAPDWLEPVSPMPGDTPGATRPEIGIDEAPPLDAPSEEAELLDLEEVIAEDTAPPTPPRSTRVTAAPAFRDAMEMETEPELGADDDEQALGDADDDDFSLGSLVRGDSSDSDEEAVLAELGPAPSVPEPEDLAPVRRTAPQARPSPVTRPTPARATPVKAAPAKPVAAAKPAPTPAKPATAKVTPPKSRPNGEDEFDLSNLVDDEESPSRPQPALAPPAKDDDDNLDALFDEIQIGDK